MPQVVRELPIPLYEWLSSFGTRVYDLQDRVRCGLPETVGQEGVVPPRIPSYQCANQDSHLPTASHVFSHPLYASRTCEHRPLPTRSSVKWKCLERTLKVSVRKKTNQRPPLPRKAPPWARRPKGKLQAKSTGHTYQFQIMESIGVPRSEAIRIIGWSTSHQSLS